MPNLGDMVVRIVGNNAEFDKSIDKSQTKFDKFEKSALKIGKTLTKYITLPMLALGGASIKAASDAEETAAKFGSAFKSVRKQADITAKSLAKDYGLSNTAAQRLLSSTGDLLKGFGATGAQALDLSNQVQELAVDLSSYNNIVGGGARASQILTRAMLGEREALTSLGVKVSEADVKNRLMAEGLEKLEGRELLLARAQVTLKLVTEQSGDAMGDFARTSDSVANRVRIARADINNLLVTMGNDLLPAVAKILKGFSGFVQRLNEMDAGTRKVVIGIALVAASIGPLLIVTAKLVASFIAIKKAIIGSTIAMKALDLVMKTTPIGLAVGLVTVAIVGLVKVLGDMKRRTNEQAAAQIRFKESIEASKEATEGLTEATYLSNEAREKAVALALKAALAEKELTISTYETAIALGNMPADQLKFTYELMEKLREQVALLQKQIAGGGKAPAGDAPGLTKDQNLFLKAEENIQNAIAATVEAEKFAISNGEEYNGMAERRKIIIDEINNLIDKGFTIEGAAIQSLLAGFGPLLDAYEEELGILEEIAEQKEENARLADEQHEQTLGNIKDEQGTRANALKKRLDGYLIVKNAVDEANKKAKDAADKAAREEAARIEETKQAWFSLTSSLLSSFTSIGQNYADMRKRAIQEVADAEIAEFKRVRDELLDSRDDIESASEAAFKKEIQDAKDKGEALSAAEVAYSAFLEGQEEERFAAMSEAEQNEYTLKDKAAKAQEKRESDLTTALNNLETARTAALETEEAKRLGIEKDFDDKRKVAQNTANMAQWRVDVAIARANKVQAATELAINSIVAVSKLLAMGRIGLAIGTGAAAIVGAAAIASKPLPQQPIPLARGAVVRPSPGGTLANIAERGETEVVLPLNKLGAMLDNRSPVPDSRVGGDEEGGGMTHLIVNVDSQPILESIFPATQNHTVLIDGTAVVGAVGS